MSLSQKELEQHIADWTAQNKPIGEYLGYPDCCIKEFCQQPPIVMTISGPTLSDRRRYKAALIDNQFSGFIPCLSHANQILAGKIKLEDLVDENRRQSPHPFPLH